MPLRIAMIEDRPELRVALRRVIESQPDWRWAWEAESLQAARLNLDRGADILLLDLCLPDGDGLGLMPELPDGMQALVFSVLGDEANVVRAIRCGAAGYLLKESTPAEIVDAIAGVAAGGAPLTPSVAAHLLRHVRRVEAEPAAGSPAGPATGIQSPAARTHAVPPHDDPHAGLRSLTPRERDVLLALARGFSYDETGQMLGISRHTVGHHVKQIYSKLMVNSRSQAVFEAVQAGWLRDDAPR
jgi:DNA-binding NarL/FixJ family response regulator